VFNPQLPGWLKAGRPADLLLIDGCEIVCFEMRFVFTVIKAEREQVVSTVFQAASQ